MLDDGQKTITSGEQTRLEAKVQKLYEDFANKTGSEQYESLRLIREKHIDYLQMHLGNLPTEFTSLDASRTWIVFWVVHSLALLKAPLPDKPSRKAIIVFLRSCQHPQGGFGGGPHQLPHLAATYAAVAALVTLGGPEALGVVDRKGMMQFMESMCVDPERGGGFTIYDKGEIDIRGCYTAIATAHMLGLDKTRLVEKSGMVDYIKRCQSHEGGLGGEPGNEAHGGNTFCGIAALELIGCVDVLDLDRLLHWLVHMQGSIEGGFMGRNNKLVDGCYSYWQGAIFLLLKGVFVECFTASDAQNSIDASMPDIPDLPTISLSEPRAQMRQHEQKRIGVLADVLGISPEDIDSLIQSESLEDSSEDDDTPDGYRRDALRRALRSSRASILATKFNVCSILQDALAVSESEIPLVSEIPGANISPSSALYNVLALQFWILRSSQWKSGGFRDKPGKPVDLYHTCYCLSGLASAQQYSGMVLGPVDNVLATTDPTVNIADSKLDDALAYYLANPL